MTSFKSYNGMSGYQASRRRTQFMHREREKRPGPLFTGGVVSTPNQQHHGGREDVNGRKVLIGRDCVSPDMRHVEKHDLYLKRAAKPGGPPSAPTINSLRRTQSSGRRRRSRTLTNHEVFALTSIATGTAFAFPSLWPRVHPVHRM